MADNVTVNIVGGTTDRALAVYQCETGYEFMLELNTTILVCAGDNDIVHHLHRKNMSDIFDEMDVAPQCVSKFEHTFYIHLV